MGTGDLLNILSLKVVNNAAVGMVTSNSSRARTIRNLISLIRSNFTRWSTLGFAGCRKTIFPPLFYFSRVGLGSWGTIVL